MKFNYVGPKEIFFQDIPVNSTVQEYISLNTNINKAIEAYSDYKTNEVLSVSLPISTEQLISSYDKLLQKVTPFPWRTGDQKFDAYKSISMTYNPDHQDGYDPFSSSIGTERALSFYSFADSNQTYQNIKNSYYDAYSFRKIHPTILEAFGHLFNSFNLSLIRSRLSIINKNEPMITGSKFGWHVDEPIFHNLRLNVPIITDPNYYLEIKSDTFNYDEHLKTGCGYVWNTIQPHRAYAKAMPTIDRAHIVFGFTPWLNYSNQTDSWKPNEYWGLHPFEMVKQGLLFK